MDARADADPLPELQAGPLRLVPLVEAHAAALFPVLADPALYAFLDQGPPASAEALAAVYRRLETRVSPDGTEAWLNWAIVDPEGQPCGFVQATGLPDGQAWVAYVLGRHWWGRGWARMATQAMLDHLARDHGVTRFLASVERDHLRSQRLLEALGFAPAQDDEVARWGLAASERLLVRGVRG